MKEKRSNYIAKERLGYFVACTVVYLFLDVPFRAMRFLSLLPLAGPKDTLPMMAELVFGPTDVLGMAVGALISGWASGASFRAVASEAVSVAATSTFFYRFWYLIRRDGKTDLKSAGYMIQFFLTRMVAGFLMGGLEGILLADSYDSGFLMLCLEVGLSSSAWLLLIGIPVFILLTSVFAIHPWVPVHLFVTEGREEAGELVMDIGSDMQELAGVEGAVVLYNEQKGIPAQHSYAVMSCVEELGVLIQQRLPETGRIHICIHSGGNMMAHLQYPEERCNLFAVRVASEGPGTSPDILGILVVRGMAVRVGYRRRQEENELTMII